MPPPCARAGATTAWTCRGCDPAHVLVIGLGVARILRAELDAAFPGRWQAVPQPMGARGLAPTAALHATLAEAARRHAD